MAVKTRNSSIELLRILCIFGIIFMHTIAYGGDELSHDVLNPARVPL